MWLDVYFTGKNMSGGVTLPSLFQRSRIWNAFVVPERSAKTIGKWNRHDHQAS